MFVNPKRRKNSAPAPEDESARRVPAQERSKKRVERILEAAAIDFAESGFDATTMEGIAARAETSIGSIYQFFPNKLSVFQALQRTYQEKLEALFAVLLNEETMNLPWTDVLDAGIDGFTAFHETEPGFRAVWLGLHLTREMVEEGEALNRRFATRVADWLAAKAKNLPPKDRVLVATIIVEIMSAMLIQAARRGPKEGKALMAETKVLLRRYLAPYAGGMPRAAKRKA